MKKAPGEGAFENKPKVIKKNRKGFS